MQVSHQCCLLSFSVIVTAEILLLQRDRTHTRKEMQHSGFLVLNLPWGKSQLMLCATVCTTMCWLRTLLCLSSREVAKPQVQDQHFLNITQIIISGFIPKGNGYNILNTARLDREHGQYSNLKNSCSIAVEVTLLNLVMQSALFPISSAGCS